MMMILMNRNDIRTNENSRRNQDSIFTNKLDQLKQKQIGSRGINNLKNLYFKLPWPPQEPFVMKLNEGCSN